MLNRGDHGGEIFDAKNEMNNKFMHYDDFTNEASASQNFSRRHCDKLERFVIRKKHI